MAADRTGREGSGVCERFRIRCGARRALRLLGGRKRPRAAPRSALRRSPYATISVRNVWSGELAGAYPDRCIEPTHCASDGGGGVVEAPVRAYVVADHVADRLPQEASLRRQSRAQREAAFHPRGQDEPRLRGADRGTSRRQRTGVVGALKTADLKRPPEAKRWCGSWGPVRWRGRPADRKTAWRLTKHRDQWGSTEDITELAPRSVVTNRLLIEI